MALAELKLRQRSDYGFFLDCCTRWNDNDMYGHVNNSIYYFLFDSIVNTYLIQHCGLQPLTSAQIGLVVHSHCNYFSPVSFPATLKLGLRTNRLGTSSVEYEIGVFERGCPEVKAVGGFVHVFVAREAGRPVKQGMPLEMREGLEKLLQRGSISSKL
ncbi:thioesterase family protein [Xylona heveae TC161]|uniref:Thioesterase family protein n=1 Tax=Xylona heveae (strain CBS 132557 / TC161) TaxID=1328760 RepID=A0A165JS73_XYLHT|nr:thioesterase family protein [Xylona heveae TC161]KZF26560.1 thioesterase family protein [Xylona heveae TC161]